MLDPDCTSSTPRAYLDGLHCVLGRGRARRFRRDAAALGLGVPPVQRIPNGLHVQLGAAPLARDLLPLVDLLEAFDARLVRLEVARDFRCFRSLRSPDARLARLLRTIRLRSMPERDWLQPKGCACYYLGPSEQPVNGCAYVRERSKLSSVPGPVLHVELRLSGTALRKRKLHRPRALLDLQAPRDALALWRVTYARRK